MRLCSKTGVISLSETLYSNGLYPKTILAKMQDSSAKELICIASLRLEAMDRNQGLSLLKTADFRDDYCHKREELLSCKDLHQIRSNFSFKSLYRSKNTQF